MNMESDIKINVDEPVLEGKMEIDEHLWGELRNKVEEFYHKNKVPEELIEQFKIHNRQVEDFVIRFSEEEQFNDKEKEIAVLAAIFHDVTKGWKDFLKHGEEGGKIAKDVLLEMGKSEGLARSVQFAVERHMGQDGYTAEKAKEAYGKDFEYPKYKTKVGQIVYECDIMTQLTKEGFEKIILLRKTDADNLEEDRKAAKSKNISIDEARILSVLASAEKSLMIIRSGPFESIKKHAEELWREIQENYPI